MDPTQFLCPARFLSFLFCLPTPQSWAFNFPFVFLPPLLFIFPLVFLLLSALPYPHPSLLCDNSLTPLSLMANRHKTLPPLLTHTHTHTHCVNKLTARLASNHLSLRRTSSSVIAVIDYIMNSLALSIAGGKKMAKQQLCFFSSFFLSSFHLLPPTGQKERQR